MHMLAPQIRLRVNGVEIVCQRLGQPDRPAVLLIMGLGGQLISWPEALCETLLGEGFQVIRFDNRDAGLSSKFDHHGRPRLLRIAAARHLGLTRRLPYQLQDMAEDALALLDALEIRQAHLVGISMGGMIAQIMAGMAPGCCLSLASLMSSSGCGQLPGPSLRLRLRMLRGRAADPEGALREAMRSIRIIGSPAYPRSEAELRQALEPQVRRSVCPDGVHRQLAAIVGSDCRLSLLARIRAPTLILHGAADPLIPVAAAHDLARRIPHAVKDIVPGLGHDLPAAALPRIGAALCGHLQRAGQDRSSAAAEMAEVLMPGPAMATPWPLNQAAGSGERSG